MLVHSSHLNRLAPPLSTDWHYASLAALVEAKRGAEPSDEERGINNQ
jgi:hypothetical protein